MLSSRESFVNKITMMLIPKEGLGHYHCKCLNSIVFTNALDLFKLCGRVLQNCNKKIMLEIKCMNKTNHPILFFYSKSTC